MVSEKTLETLPAWKLKKLKEEEARQKEYLQRPEAKAKQKEYRQRPEVKAKQKEYAQRPEVKAKQKEYAQRPEVKAKQKEYRQRPEVKAKQKEYRQRPEAKAKKNRHVSISIAVEDFLTHFKPGKFRSKNELDQTILNYGKAVCSIQGNCDKVVKEIKESDEYKNYKNHGLKLNQRHRKKNRGKVNEKNG